MIRRYQVFVSSTYADLKEERAKVIQTIMELDCIPAGMEIFPAIDEEQFEFIKKIIDDCDYYILIIGGRYGSLTSDGISYTEKEYDYALEKDIKVLAFIHANPDEIPLGKSEKDTTFSRKLELFKQKVSSNRLVKHWNNANELPGMVSLSLSKTIKTYPAIGWVRSNTTAGPEVYSEMNTLRKENQELRNNIQLLVQQQNSNKINKTYNLAGLNDSIEIKGINKRWSKGINQDIITKWSLTITWEQIFAIISPYLLEHPHDNIVKQRLSSELYSLTKDSSESGRVEIMDQDFQTIKIQLSALDLIKVTYTPTTKGGMGLFWNLTENGNKVMLQIRSVKK